MGWLEVLGLIVSPLHPGFVPTIGYKNAPILGPLIAGLQCVFVDRGGTEEGRAKAIATLGERQQIIHDHTGVEQKYRPICVFAEGTTTNGGCIMKFKKGAFMSHLPITPSFVKLNYCGPVNPAYDIIKFWDLAIMCFSSFSFNHCVLHIMPPFRPN